jgi:hypothetical protein
MKTTKKFRGGSQGPAYEQFHAWTEAEQPNILHMTVVNQYSDSLVIIVVYEKTPTEIIPSPPDNAL